MDERLCWGCLDGWCDGEGSEPFWDDDCANERLYGDVSDLGLYREALVGFRSE